MDTFINDSVVYERHNGRNGQYTLRYVSPGHEYFNERILANMCRLREYGRLPDYNINSDKNKCVFTPAERPYVSSTEIIEIEVVEEKRPEWGEIKLEWFKDTLDLMKTSGKNVAYCFDGKSQGAVFFNGLVFSFSFNRIFFSLVWSPGIEGFIGTFKKEFGRAFSSLLPDKEVVWDMHTDTLNVLNYCGENTVSAIIHVQDKK